ncbi:MAG: hypothetical protein C0168_10955 [Candidatus Aminicenantes bacterium]|nr:MAG: hypothetical protein C0168_10955 [Candidatus Aminicenantes bacterium]
MAKKEKSIARKISGKKILSLGALIFSVAVFLFVTLEISRLLEARSSGKKVQEIKLKVEQKNTWSHSQISPLHRIPLMDEFNQKIIPAVPNTLPFSSRNTCGPCHDYDQISHGTHFNLKNRAASDRRTEPFVLFDEKAGLQLPISFQGYPGLWSPEELGLNSWQFLNLFGRNLPGGGLGEPTEKDITPDSRWNVSGKLEINCLGCHNKSYLQDHSEWAKQIMRQNFRWAATAASGLGEVPGMASRLHSTWSVIDGPNPDDHEWAVVPEVRYDQNLFDSKNNAVLNLGQPEDRNCLACHTVTARKAASRAEVEQDVHSAAGLRCVDCHRNDLSHEMIRGYEGQKLAHSNLKAEDYTCAGCHLGQNPEKGGFGFTGKLGAPRPAHKGIPKIHFERLSCTVCHSGLLPKKELQEVYTSRSNRLGIFGKADWTSEYPVIVEPVYVREKDGKIYPERMMWPAFWAEKKGQELIPLQVEEVLKAAPEVFNLKENVSAKLSALGPLAEEGFYPAVVISDFLFEPNADASLNAKRLDQSPLSGRSGEKKFLLVQIKGEKTMPLLPVFNPDEAPPEVEDKILNSLQALKALSNGQEPVFIVGKYVYKITEGYISKEEKPGEPAAEPGIFWLVDGKFEPWLSEYEIRTLAALGDSPEILTEEQVKMVLKKMAEIRPGHQVVYVASGLVFSLNKNGQLETSKHPAAEPIYWPLAHNVRPVQEALGKNGCTDCHSPGSNIFFGQVKAVSPLKSERREEKLGADFMGTGQLFQFLFGLTFLVRPYFKLLLAACVLLLGLVITLVLIKITGQITKLNSRDSDRRIGEK